MADPREEAGRVELIWPGKYVDGERAPLLDHGARLVEREHLPGSPARTDLDLGGGDLGGGLGRAPACDADALILGDNLLVLEALVRERPGCADLIYIDPPFATGGRFSLSRRVGDKREGDAQTLRLPAFDDAWEGGEAGFLRMMDPRLRLLHQLLGPTGSLYLHVDPTMGHALKLLLDEVFGPGCFQREIVWRIGWLSGFKTRARNWIRNHDLIFFYTKDPRNFTFNKHYVPHPEGYRRRDGKPSKAPGVPMEDVWNANAIEAGLSGRASLDSIQIKSFSGEKTGWATQKNESVLERIIEASSDPGQLVVDVFGGSGTTAVVAARLGRRFLICDHAEAAVQISRARLLGLESERRGFRVWTLDARERAVWLERDAALAGVSPAVLLTRWTLAQLEAEALTPVPSEQGPQRFLVGRRGDIGVALVSGIEGPARVDAALVGALRSAAAERGFRALEIVAFEWEAGPSAAVAESAPREEAALPSTALVFTRGLWEASVRKTSWLAGGAALRERPSLDLALTHGVAGGLNIELRGLSWSQPERLPEALRGRPFEALVVGWSLARTESRAELLWVETRVGRRLALAAELGADALTGGAGGPGRYCFAVEDILGMRHTWDVTST